MGSLPRSARTSCDGLGDVLAGRPGRWRGTAPSGFMAEHRLGGGVRRARPSRCSRAALSAADDVELDAAVDRHHVEAVVGGAGVPALFAAHRARPGRARTGVAAQAVPAPARAGVSASRQQRAACCPRRGCMRVSARVSTPQMPGMWFSSSTSASVRV